MTSTPTPDPARLRATRDQVQSFLERRKRLTTALFVLAGLAEGVFFVAMLLFMDFGQQLYWFLLFGFLLVYTPLILFTWRNALLVDQLFYRLVEELRLRDRTPPADEERRP